LSSRQKDSVLLPTGKKIVLSRSVALLCRFFKPLISGFRVFFYTVPGSECAADRVLRVGITFFSTEECSGKWSRDCPGLRLNLKSLGIK
jgi:hypothetical protein